MDTTENPSRPRSPWRPFAVAVGAPCLAVAITAAVVTVNAVMRWRQAGGLPGSTLDATAYSGWTLAVAGAAIGGALVRGSAVRRAMAAVAFGAVAFVGFIAATSAYAALIYRLLEPSLE